MISFLIEMEKNQNNTFFFLLPRKVLFFPIHLLLYILQFKKRRNLENALSKSLPKPREPQSA